jgi:hypothetical protein
LFAVQASLEKAKMMQTVIETFAAGDAEVLQSLQASIVAQISDMLKLTKLSTRLALVFNLKGESF